MRGRLRGAGVLAGAGAADGVDARATAGSFCVHEADVSAMLMTTTKAQNLMVRVL